MDLRVIFIFIVFLILYGFYAINLFFPQRTKLKYFVSISFAFLGLLGWGLVLVRKGGLITGFVSSALLVLSGLSFLIALGLDLAAKLKTKNYNK